MKRLALVLILAIALPTVSFGQQEIKTVSPERFAQLMDSLDVYQLVDVRTTAEFKDGHIQGAKQYDVNKPQFERRVSRLNRSQPVLLYCRTGKRSLRAAQLLQEMGFQEIINLAGGITTWKAEGYPIKE